jgi:hypothetical protein
MIKDKHEYKMSVRGQACKDDHFFEAGARQSMCEAKARQIQGRAKGKQRQGTAQERGQGMGQGRKYGGAEGSIEKGERQCREQVGEGDEVEASGGQGRAGARMVTSSVRR